MQREQVNRDASEAANVELADSAMIAQLMDSRSAARPARARRQDRGAAPAKRAVSRRCNCGKCRTCLDNARWELVFQEKFADPYYYSLHPPRQGSSLNGF
jgi:hypothetical protein